MTSATGAEEVPFVSGMEHEPEKLCETTIKVGRKLFLLDGMLTRVLEKARMAMARPDRDGPVDYEREDDDIRRLADIIERLVQRPPDNGYREAPKEPKDSNLKGVIIGCTISIVSAGIIGVVVLSNNFSALRAEFAEWKIATEHRLQQLERRP